MTNTNKLNSIYIKNSDGFTITTNLNKIKKRSGYCVSITNNYLKIIDYNKGIKRLHNNLLKTKTTLRGYKLYYGGWKSNKVFYLDYTIIEENKQKAIQIAKKHNQKAIFNLSKFEVIQIKYL